LTGTVTAGERWSLVLDGVQKFYTFAAGDTASSVAASLRTLLAGTGYTVGGSAASVTIKKTDGSAFSLRATDASTLATHPTATFSGTNDPLHWSKVKLVF